MEATTNKLYFKNNSDQKLKLLLNAAYPDSSLRRSGPIDYTNPNGGVYVATTEGLERVGGLTLFVFDYGYYHRKWHADAGTPDTYLDEDSILRRYCYSKRQLDSLGWLLVYP